MKIKTLIIVSLLLGTIIHSQASLSSLLEPLLEMPATSNKSNNDEPVNDLSIQLSYDKKKQESQVLSHILSREELAESLSNALKNKFNIKGELKVHVAKNQPRIFVDPADWSLEVTRFPGNGLDKNIIIGFKVKTQEQNVGEWTMPIRCELWRGTYVSTKQIEQGEQLFSENFDIQTLDILQMPQSPVLADEDNLSDFEARKTISADTPLLYRDIREQPDVRKGQVVEVVAKDGLLNISMKAQVLEDGFNKEFITVRNLDSKKKFQAQVIDESTVQVYF